MKLVTPRQMSQIDRNAIEKLGIPGAVLMENAALAVVSEVKSLLNESGIQRVVVIAGKGNNGGDGFAIARHLFNGGVRTEVFIIAPKAEISGDAGINLNIIEKIGVSIKEITEQEGTAAIQRALECPCVIVDAIYGTGLKGEVTGLVRDVINEVNKSCNPVVSVDIPSGVNGETGEINGVCIDATRTVTFGFPKLGLIISPGCEKTGRLVTEGIGIPSAAWKDIQFDTFLLGKEELEGVVRRRKKESNKGDYGRVLLVTGSTGMTGAGCLAASAALRAGAGLVYIAAPASLGDVYAKNVRETIFLPLEDEGKGVLSSKAIAQLEAALTGKSAVAVGPGLSLKGEVWELVRFILENAEVPLVLDADALNSIADDVSVLAKIKNRAVITPHPGEMSRLTGKSIEFIQENRLEIAREFSTKWKVITVLKGFRTVIAMPDGKAYINITGNAGMATAGTGDVLTGIIAALAGQGIPLGKAALAGVYLHGRAGDIAASEFGEYSLVASDVTAGLPEAFEEILL